MQDYQEQVWTVVLAVWGVGFGLFALMFVTMGLMMLWQESKEAIFGNVAIVLNVLAFVAIAVFELTKLGALTVWSWTVPDFSAQDE